MLGGNILATARLAYTVSGKIIATARLESHITLLLSENTPCHR